MTQNSAARKRRLTRERSLTLVVVLLAILSVGLVFAAEVVDQRTGTYGLEGWRGKLYDGAVSLRVRLAEEPVDPRVVLVSIETSTYQLLDQVRLDRAYHADVLRELHDAGARVVVFDLIFDRDDPDDELFAEAIREHGRVVLAADLEAQEQTGTLETSAVFSLNLPNERLREHAAVGIANVPEDIADRTLRRFEWYFVALDEEARLASYPALGVAAAAVNEGIADLPAALAALQEGRFGGEQVALLPGSRTSYIEYHAPQGRGFRRLPYERLLGWPLPLGEAERALLDGAIVVIGDTTGIGHDMHRTPIANPTTRSNTMPGVEIQAGILHTILAGHYTQTLPPGQHWLLVFCAALAGGLAARWFGGWPALFAAGLLLFGGLGALTFLGATARFWVEPVTPFLAGTLAFGLSTVYMNRAVRRHQREIKQHFSRFVGRQVMDEILQEGHVELSGEQRPVTLLFSDLQGFTGLSEGRSAREVVSLLNDYFDTVIPVIFKHGGTLDKLMGDGIMAYFGAPQRNQPDHAARAVRCALEMQERLEAFRQNPRRQGLPPLRMRIGLHTGEAVVGEIGWKERVEYSVIGDVVNVASRLEGLNKEYGTTILMSEGAYRAAGEVADAEFMGSTQVKGRQEPVAVYAVGPRAPEREDRETAREDRETERRGEGENG